MNIPSHFRAAYSGIIHKLHSLHIKCWCGSGGVGVWLTRLNVCFVAGMSLEEVREFEKQLQQETNQKLKHDMSNSGSISKQKKKDSEEGGQ